MQQMSFISGQLSKRPTYNNLCEHDVVVPKEGATSLAASQLKRQPLEVQESVNGLI